MPETNRDIAQRTQEKFEWYFLALIFTILSLSVQTAKLGNSFGADCFEVLGWIFLFVAGIAGLSRIEGIPGQFLAFDLKDDVSAQKSQVQRAGVLSGEIFDISVQKDRPISEVIVEIDAKAKLIEEKSQEIARRLAWKYRLERFGFMCGVALLIVSRAFVVFAKAVAVWF